QSGVLNGRTVDAVWAGTWSGMARTTDGKLASWGRIWANLFVPGSTDNNPLPVAVSTESLPTGSYFVTAAGGPTAGHSLAIVALPVAPRLAVELSTGTSLISDVSAVDFGSIALNGTVHQILNIKNTGSAPLTFQGVGIGGTEGSYFRTSVLPAVLNAGASTSLDLTFTPLTEIAARAALTLSSNDPAHPLFRLGLEGSGYVPVPPVIVANYQNASDVPLTISRINATNVGVAFSLSFAPPVGTNLTVVNNTGREFIQGVFTQGRFTSGGTFFPEMVPLYQGKQVTLTYGGKSYNFVANYFGGTGNDLVLQWADTVAVGCGYNGQSQLGNGAAASSALPVKVDDSGVLKNRTVITMAAGAVHSLALCSDGTIAAWGVNSYGELGNGSTTNAFVPLAVSRSGVLGGKTAAAIAVGQYHSLALCSDGTVAAWGSNDFGQLGNGSTTQSTAPVKVNFSGALAGKSVIAIAAGQFHSLALCLDGTVAAWGSNIDGGLGNKSTTDSLVPVAVDATGVLAGKIVVGISAGQYHSLAVCSDGTLAAWGGNIFGALGNNSSANCPVPVAVDATGVLAGKTPVAVAAGQFHSVALCSDGTVAAWGANFYGALGDSTTISSAAPVAVDRSGVLAGRTVTSVAAASLHSLAYCSDGTIATWGYNGVGQLGVDAPNYSTVPVAVNTSSSPVGSRCIAATTGSMASHNLALVAIVPVPELLVVDSANLPVNSGDTLNYGRVNENGLLVKNFTLMNTGRVTLSFSIPTFAGTSASEFSLQRQLTSVFPGSSTSLEIAYRPLTDAPDLATFAVATNDPLIPVFTLSLSGGGIIPSIAPLTADLNAANQASFTQSYLYATGRNVSFSLNFPPAAGTNLTIVSNTGADPIRGTFKNLAQGQLVELTYLRTSYLFVANYFGGDGNDLVLEWAPGPYYGLVQAQTGTARSLSTEGSFSASVSSSRTFTGKLTMGTAFFPVVGTFGSDGVATFGTKKERSLVFPRGALPSLTFALKFGDKGGLSGTVTQTLQGVVQGVSTIQADHATDASSITVNGNYSVLLPSIPPGIASPQTQGLTSSDYPQAPGFGSLTILKTGSASFAISLPDGTVFSAATILVGRNAASLSLPLFASVGKGVSVSATVLADAANTASDLSTGTGYFFWAKAPSTSAYYPDGWPQGIVTQLFAARYQAPVPGQNILPGLAPSNSQGNAVLQVDQEAGIVPKTYPINLNADNTVSYAFPATPGLTLMLTPATGMFTGGFLAADNTRVTYKGTVYQKGTALVGGWGFYLSPLARVKGARGEGRAVMLNRR
ncbi:MAG: hypothetical protein JWO08_2138, partial [Verrucomicrobiaceae bacterium]|nr:hypothetical protein [Verrucomicrobiaceae bacterium]